MLTTKKKPRVFVVHEPLRKITDQKTGTVSWVKIRDIEVAREFGDLIYVYPAGHLTQDMSCLVEVARDRMKDFTDDDFLLPCGDMVAISLTAIEAAQQLEGNTLKMLVWDNRQSRYFLRNLEVWQDDPDEAQIVTDEFCEANHG